MKINLKNPSAWINITTCFIIAIVSVIIAVYIGSCNVKSILNDRIIQNVKVVNYKNNNQESLIKDNYIDFLIHHYETQSDFLNFWLTLLAIFAGFAGIGIPLIMNASYAEKIKQVESKFAMQKIRMTKEYTKKLKSINEVEAKAKGVMDNIQNRDMLLQKNQQTLVPEVSQAVQEHANEAILSEINTEVAFYSSRADEAFNSDNKQESANYLTRAIDVCQLSEIKYSLNRALNLKLIHLFGMRACSYFNLNSQLSEKDYKTAIELAESTNVENVELFIRVNYAQLVGLYIIYEKFDKVMEFIDIIQSDENKKFLKKEDMANWLTFLENSQGVSQIKTRINQLMLTVPD